MSTRPVPSGIAKHCPFGAPKGPTVKTTLIVRDGYALRHHNVRKSALWVCEGVTKKQLLGKLPRPTGFRKDPKLKKGEWSVHSDYTHSGGYDRGHLAPAGDQTVDARLKKETFFMSNIAPQKDLFNRCIWCTVEWQAREWVKARGFAYVITGPIGGGPNKTIGKHKVWVPTDFYKIIVAKDSTGKWQAIAFVIPNRMYKWPFRFKSFIKSVDYIEQKTGLNFMPGLNMAEEKRLESKPSSLWTMGTQSRCRCLTRVNQSTGKLQCPKR